MGLYTCRLLLLLVCIGSLTLQAEKVHGLRRLDMVLRNAEHGVAAEKPHDIHVVGLDTKKKSAISPSQFDPNQTSKRRVRRGSDPIHNRC